MAIIQFLAPGVTASTTKEDAAFTKALTKLQAAISTAVQDPSTLAADIQELVAGEEGAGGVSLLGGLQALRKLVAFGNNLKTVAQTTASRIQQFTNQAAIVNLVKRSAIVEMARLSKDLPFESLNEAVAVRDEIADLLEIEALTTTDDSVFTSLMDLRAGVVQDITARSANFARLETKAPAQISNSLVTAYELYGDATREREIVERNDVIMPGFLSPNNPLLVLNQ